MSADQSKAQISKTLQEVSDDQNIDGSNQLLF
jgi:hypothetical protein